MKKLRIALLASCAMIGASMIVNHRTPIISEAAAQMANFGGTRLVPLGFCSYNPTTASTNILNGTTGCIVGVFGTIGAGIAGTGPSVLPATAKYAQVCVTGSNSGAAFYRDDGIAAVVSGSGGMPMGFNSTLNCIFYAGNLSAFSIIQATGTVSVLLYGQP